MYAVVNFCVVWPQLPRAMEVASDTEECIHEQPYLIVIFNLYISFSIVTTI